MRRAPGTTTAAAEGSLTLRPPRGTDWADSLDGGRGFDSDAVVADNAPTPGGSGRMGTARPMKLAVVSHKQCWVDAASPSGFATDGGFPRQMAALSGLFDETNLVLPCGPKPAGAAGAPLIGANLRVTPLRPLGGAGLRRKLGVPLWMARNAGTLLRSVREADVLHPPVPGDVGTIGMLLGLLTRKRMFVRHCGNWRHPRTVADRVRRWAFERFAGPTRPMFATGAGASAPSARNPHLRWIFSTSLSRVDIAQHAQRRAAPARGPSRLITVGRQEQGKGTEHAIRALPRLRADGVETRLSVVGGGSQLDALRALAATEGVAEHVELCGALPPSDVMDRLAAADLFLLLSRSEGFPKVVIEAMACGLPVVATGVSALPTLLATGSGRIVDSTDAAAVARVVRECLADDATYARMSDQALETAARHSLEAWAESLAAPLARAWGPLRRDAG